MELIYKYEWWILLQVVIGVLLNKYCNRLVEKFGSINTLVLAPIAPVLALVLFALTRVKNKDYYSGYIFLLPLIVIVIMMKSMGAPIIVFSIILTCVVYSFNIKQDGVGPVIISVFVGWLCRDMANPISFIITCNMFSDYIVKNVFKSKTNKFKSTKVGYDNEGTNGTLIGAFLEAAFIGAPSDVVSNNKDMMDGLADVLCIINFLINGSMRGSATVVVTSPSSALIFFGIIGIIYFYNTNLEYIEESDKVWPCEYKTDVPHVTKLQLGLITMVLVMGYNLTDYWLVGKLVLVTMCCCLVRIKVMTSLFFSANVLFK